MQNCQAQTSESTSAQHIFSCFYHAVKRMQKQAGVQCTPFLQAVGFDMNTVKNRVIDETMVILGMHLKIANLASDLIRQKVQSAAVVAVLCLKVFIG